MVGASRGPSCRLAPATTTPMGSPLPSTIRERLGALLAPVHCCAPGLMEAVIAGRITAHGTEKVSVGAA